MVPFPMKRDEAISRLQRHEADLKRLGVEYLYMFGSMARDEANHDSDVGLFFDYQTGKLGVFELMDVKEYAASILGRNTDIMTRDSLHETLRQAIEGNNGPRALVTARSLIPGLTDIIEAIERIHGVEQPTLELIGCRVVSRSGFADVALEPGVFNFI